MNWLKSLMTICGFIGEWTETKGQQCLGYSEEDVKCSKLTLISGNVCYDWQWESGLVFDTWKWSLGTFICKPGYNLSTPQNKLHCFEDCGVILCSVQWDGVPPVCQKTETTASTPSSTSMTTTTWTTTPVSTETTQEETAVNVSNITTLSHSSLTVPASKESSRKTITSTRIPEFLETKDVSDKEQNQLIVYVTVPLVAVVSLVTLVLVYVIFRRKRTTGNSKVRNNQKTTVRDAGPNFEKKNEAYDPYINLVEDPQVEDNARTTADITQQKLERDTCSSFRDISPNNVKRHDAGKRDEDENEYDHLGPEAHAVTDSTYSHTSHQGDLGMYSHTHSTAPSGVPTTVSGNLNTALKDTEQTYDEMNRCTTNYSSQINNKSDQKGMTSAQVSEDNNLYTVAQKISK